MNVGDRVMTPAGLGTIVGWYSKGSRVRVTVAIDEAGLEPEQTFEAVQITELPDA